MPAHHPLLRPSTLLTTKSLLPKLTNTPTATPRSLLSLRTSSPHQPYATQSYGSGTGDPKGSDPQSQGANPATSNAEHPGPAPPDVGKGTGGGPTKKSGSGHHGGEEGGSSVTGKEGGQGSGGKEGGEKGGPQPKILNDTGPPPEKELSEEVRRHNEEMAGRGDKPFERSR